MTLRHTQGHSEQSRTMKITGKTKICMTIGDPIEHSLSPQMHNANLEAAGLSGKYVFVAGHVALHDLESFIKGVRAMKIHFIGCTLPHKIAIMQYLDEIDEDAKKIGAVNTILNDNGILKGSNTDWLGVVTPLEKLVTLENKTVALLGAGGAARAAVYAVTKKGAKLQIFNRTREKAQLLVDAFGGEAFSLEHLHLVKNADIIINTTSVGMRPQVDETPLPKEFITKNHIVFDAVYTPFETKLLQDAKTKGATIIHGTEMFVNQAAAQIMLYTGQIANQDVMREAIL